MRILFRKDEERLAATLEESDRLLEQRQELIAAGEAVIADQHRQLILAARTIVLLQDTMLEQARSTHGLIVAFRLATERGINIDEELEKVEQEYADSVALAEEHYVSDE